jgi:site-specific recombinase
MISKDSVSQQLNLKDSKPKLAQFQIHFDMAWWLLTESFAILWLVISGTVTGLFRNFSDSFNLHERTVLDLVV